ncbi:MAG: CHAT domain-containing protein [Acidobacteria bacterium]|nr:MAG: CHAT domain-containing protein [Acidobacteriota bacterium]REJ98666.1 MAG: CHAT domain-containing protein [Acidobacteriota bacterium]REK16678.1 MAG: CHAT domain-containing protein [Acidobacteriota bacterium]REK42589.1 MAG: CHAT domain-containing protein [Acidobacteriota bacterium]
MKNRSILLLVLAVGFVLGSVGTSAQSADEPGRLDAGVEYSGTIKSGESIRFGFELDEDTASRIIVQQNGIDLFLSVKSDSGELIAEMDATTGGDGIESLTVTAQSGGSFVLEVTSKGSGHATGSYSVIRTLIPAGREVSERIELERRFVLALKAARSDASNPDVFARLQSISKEWSEIGEEYLAEATLEEIRSARVRLGLKLMANAREMFTSTGEENAKRSIPVLQLAFDVLLEAGEKESASLALAWLGSVSSRLGNKRSAVDFYTRALQMVVELGKKDAESALHSDLASIYLFLGDPRKALDHYSSALTIYEREGIKANVAAMLNNIAAVHNQLGNRQKALELLERSLVLARELNDKRGESVVLLVIGTTKANLQRYEEALASLDSALKLKREIKDRRGEAVAINTIAMVNRSVGEWERALRLLEESLAIRIETEDIAGQGVSYNNIDAVLNNLGLSELALVNYSKALKVAQATNNRTAEAVTRNNLGDVYADLGDLEKARSELEKSLEIWRDLGKNFGISSALNNLARLPLLSGNYSEAEALCAEALEVSEVSDDLSGRGAAIHCLGLARLRKGNAKAGIEAFNRALAIWKLQRDGLGEAQTSREMGIAYLEIGVPRLGVLYLKRAVNSYQAIRQSIRGLDESIQNAFKGQVEEVYRELAEELIAQGRLIEAENVLGLLKKQEVLKFVRQRAGSGELDGRAEYTSEELSAIQTIEDRSEDLARLGEQFENLNDLKKKGIVLSEAEKEKHRELGDMITVANRRFREFLNGLAEEFSKRPYRTNDLGESLSLQADLKQWGDDIAFVYTLVGEDRFRTILVTPTVKVAGKSETSAKVLDKKIISFRQVLRDPGLDPRPLGKEIYDIVFAGIEKELEGTKIKTLLWSLDGNLRLIPLSALWDGEKYLGEKYRNVVITLASRTKLGTTSRPDASVLGLGVSQAATVSDPAGTRNISFSALPAVPDEISSIVKTDENDEGVLPGVSLLDKSFTEDGFVDGLLGGPGIVHIASHFSLNAGDAGNSFLLLGGGNILTVQQMRNDPRISFSGVDLLTLSACETAVAGSDSTGREIEGFGYVAQQKGAKAILASLWPVVDSSTRLLMSEFYLIRNENPSVSKAEALQMAQQRMREGRIGEDRSNSTRRSDPVTVEGEGDIAPVFRRDPERPYAHPYYWSPFVLIGNWR